MSMMCFSFKDTSPNRQPKQEAICSVPAVSNTNTNTTGEVIVWLNYAVSEE